ncbi:MAG: Ribosome-binding factor A [Anaerolineales bacterium]|nr:Ribosome-binding factor A [Anaerolineales bacterium]
MVNTRRQKRISELLKEELGRLILRGVQDPRLAGVTVTDVEISPDLSYAKVFFSLIGDNEEKEDAQEALDHASGYLRHEIADRLELRRIPELSFRLDRSIERGQRILDLLYQIEQENEDDVDDEPSEAGGDVA